jgi:hypothetical protein
MLDAVTLQVWTMSLQVGAILRSQGAVTSATANGAPPGSGTALASISAMRSLRLATIFLLVGCASSRQLTEQANAHMAEARGAAAAGNYQLARAEQRKAAESYQRAAERARDEGRLPPPPPADAPLPIFDPQMQR